MPTCNSSTSAFEQPCLLDAAVQQLTWLCILEAAYRALPPGAAQASRIVSPGWGSSKATTRPAASSCTCTPASSTQQHYALQALVKSSTNKDSSNKGKGPSPMHFNFNSKTLLSITKQNAVPQNMKRKEALRSSTNHTLPCVSQHENASSSRLYLAKQQAQLACPCHVCRVC